MPRAAAMHHGVRLSAPLKTVHYAFIRSDFNSAE
jgi:hypothetical protein